MPWKPVEGAKLMYQKRGWIFDESALELCKQRASENVTPAENIELVKDIAFAGFKKLVEEDVDQ